MLSDFIQRLKDYINSGLFNSDQIYELYKGIDDGLSNEQLEYIAKPGYFSDVMHMVRKGFIYGFSVEEASLLTKE